MAQYENPLNQCGTVKCRAGRECRILSSGRYSIYTRFEITTHSDVYSDKLDLFSIAPTEKQMLYFRESRVFPMAGVNNVGPFSFQIPAMSSYFLDAGSIKVEGEIAIYERSTDGTEKKIDEGAKLIPVNMLPGESSFQKVLQRSIKRGHAFNGQTELGDGIHAT